MSPNADDAAGFLAGVGLLPVVLTALELPSNLSSASVFTLAPIGIGFVLLAVGVDAVAAARPRLFGGVGRYARPFAVGALVAAAIVVCYVGLFLVAWIPTDGGSDGPRIA